MSMQKNISRKAKTKGLDLTTSLTSCRRFGLRD